MPFSAPNPAFRNDQDAVRPQSRPYGIDTPAAEDFSQLRHLTSNALQRILAIIAEAPELHSVRGGQALSDDLQKRILTVTKLSDALFGLANPPGSLHRRLTGLANSLVELHAEDAATVKVNVTVQCGPSVRHHELLVRVAHELVGNALQHGLHHRLLGRIDIEVTEAAGQISMTIADDGWGPARRTTTGRGTCIVQALLRTVNGTHRLQRTGLRTVAEIVIPPDARRIVERQDAALRQRGRFGLEGRKLAGDARSEAEALQ